MNLKEFKTQLEKLEGQSETQKFWKFYKQYKISNKDNAVRLAELMSEYIDKDKLDDDKYKEFCLKFLNGETVTNNFGRKLYWKF